jgi:chloramphenicol-sensitive protein RarD
MDAGRAPPYVTPMSKELSSPPNETAGIVYAASSYALWGVLPLYWHMLGTVPPFELSYHRMVWSATFGVIVILALGRSSAVLAAVKNRKVLRALTLSSLFIACNWTLYIYAIAKAELVEASLGYYINPLLTIALGVAFLGERMSPLRLAAIGLAAVAVLFKALTLGHFPFIALGLAFTFAIYGYIRKLTPVAALDGMTIETCLLLPFTAGILLFWGWQGTGAFTVRHLGTDILLILGGPMTALPLILFAAGARRVRLSTLGFLQYLSPSITLLVAVFALGEPFTKTDMTAFGCVWVALVLVAFDGRVRASSKS